MEKKNPGTKDRSIKMSRRTFLSGVVAGAAATIAFSNLKKKWEYDPDKPELLYEFSVDNFWFTKVDKELMVINKPLKGKHKADIVIIGGGFTGLSSAYHLRKRYPNKKIVLLEGAYCGYGASGRNGGHHGPDIGGLLDYAAEVGPELGKKAFEVTVYGDKMVKEFATNYGVDCEYNETGGLATAFDEEHMEELKDTQEEYLELLGIESQLLQGKELKKEFNSPRCIGALKDNLSGRVNPASLVRTIKRVVEEMDVDIKEQTQVLRVTSGKIHHIETELGEITAPILVLGLNAYSHNLGFFKSGMFPVGCYNIATEPLTRTQLAEINWRNGRPVTDQRLEFNYLLLSKDNRIVIGGEEYPYFANDGLSSGNHKPIINKLENSLFITFPQLKGTKIEHKWGGTVSCTYDEIPSVGVMGEYANIYYGVGYSGHGVSFSHTAARIISDLIAGEKNDFTDFFLVNRSLPYVGPRSLRYAGFQLEKRMMQ